MCTLKYKKKSYDVSDTALVRCEKLKEWKVCNDEAIISTKDNYIEQPNIKVYVPKQTFKKHIFMVKVKILIF